MLKNLTLRIAEPKDYEQADALFEREHYLGKVKRSGACLLQIVEYQGRIVALLDWGPGALKLRIATNGLGGAVGNAPTDGHSWSTTAVSWFYQPRGCRTWRVAVYRWG